MENLDYLYRLEPSTLLELVESSPDLPFELEERLHYFDPDLHYIQNFELRLYILYCSVTKIPFSEILAQREF